MKKSRKNFQKHLKSLLTLIFMVFLTACGGGGSSGGEDDTGKISKIILNADKTTIEANGIDSVNFSINILDKENNEIKDKTAKIYVNGEEISTNKFSTQIEGNFKVYAECENIKSNEITITGQKILEIIIPETTKVITSNEKIVIENYNTENGSIELSNITLEESGIKTGDVLVAGITNKTPLGFLKKVKSIEEVNGKLIINTENAEINEAIEQGRINVSIDLKSEDVINGFTNHKNISVITKEEAKRYDDNYGYEFIINIDEMIYKENGDEIRLKGNVSINPGLDFIVDIEWFDIKEIKFGSRCDIGGTLTLTGNGEMNWNEEITLYTFYFAPITVPLGPIPLVFVPTIDIVAGANGQIKGDFKLSSSAEVKSGFYIGYDEDEGWEPTGDFNKKFVFSEPIVNATLESKVYSGPLFKISLYDSNIISIGGMLAAYVRIDADINKTPWWTIYGGAEARLRWGLAGNNYDHIFEIEEVEIINSKYYSEDGSGGYDPDYGKEKGWGKALILERDYEYLGKSTIDAQFKASYPSEDGGVIAVGSTNDIFEINGIIAEFDKKGNLLWAKGFELENSLLQIKDITESENGYIIVGEALGAEGIGFIAKIDKTGKKVWAKVIEIETDNILGGYANGFTEVIKLETNRYLLKLGTILVTIDESGKIIKTLEIGLKNEGNEMEEWIFMNGLSDIKPLGNGDFVAIGTLGYFSEAVIIKADKDLNVKWKKTFLLENENYQTEEFLIGNSVAAAENDEIFVSFHGASRGASSVVAKLDKNGNTKWMKVIESKTNDGFVYKFNLTALDNGDVVLSGGGSTLELSDYKTAVIRVSGNGIYQWGKVFTYENEQESFYFNEAKERTDSKGIFVSGDFPLIKYLTMSGNEKIRNAPAMLMFNETGEMDKKGEFEGIEISEFSETLYEDGYKIKDTNIYTVENKSMEVKLENSINWEEISYDITNLTY